MRFNDKLMQQNYDAAVKAYNAKHRDLFIKGKRRERGNYGSAFATFFWRGFDGEPLRRGEWLLVGYAFYAAGRDMAKAEQEQKLAVIANLQRKRMPTRKL